MVPSDFANYFLASTGAGAALVGLLFVAISISPERFFGRDAAPEYQAVAASAFSALVNAFFVSLTALIPKTNVGGVAVVMGALALFNALQQARRLWNSHIGLLRLVRRMSLPLISLLVYGLEVSFGIDLLQHDRAVGTLDSLCILLLVIYGLGLTRAWELLGAPRTGLLGGLFDPLKNLREGEVLASRDAGPTSESTLPQDATDRAPGHRDTLISRRQLSEP